MTPSSQRKEPPVIPDRFKDLDALTLLDALASCGKTSSKIPTERHQTPTSKSLPAGTESGDLIISTCHGLTRSTRPRFPPPSVPPQGSQRRREPRAQRSTCLGPPHQQS